MTFADFHRVPGKRPKPLLTGAFGTAEDSPGARAGCFKNVGRQLHALSGFIKTLIHFNSATARN
jgi:hypothetical protein